MRKQILRIIKAVVIDARGHNCWLSVWHIIKDKLDRLVPSVPEDGTTGLIAFDVPGRDRMKIRTGRFLTRKLNLNSGFLKDSDIARIANDINTLFFPGIVETKLVSGHQITRYYEDEIGAVTCMTPNGAGSGPDCTLLYEQNPDRFQMLAMFYLNDSARAIVHKLNNGDYFLDRVYCSTEMLRDKMRDYARDHGWHYRLNDDACEYDASCDPEYLVVGNLRYTDGNVPYMDTMVNGCLCGGDLRISASGCCDGEAALIQYDPKVGNPQAKIIGRRI